MSASPAPSSSEHIKTYNLRIGTTSEFIPPQHRPTIKDVNTHKWRMYLRGPPENPDPSFLVKSCRLQLDKSYEPNDVVLLSSYPFHISRRGFSGFQIPVQINLWNGETIRFTHQLSLNNNVDQEKVERETNVEIVIDESQEAPDESEISAKRKRDESLDEGASSSGEENAASDGSGSGAPPHKKVGKRRKKSGGKRGKKKK